MANNILQVLAKLDVNNDEHWTHDGAPALSVVKELAGCMVTRSDIAEVAKGFCRSRADEFFSIAEEAPVSVSSDDPEVCEEAQADAANVPSVPVQDDEAAPGYDSASLAAESEYKAAQLALIEAQKRLKVATTAMDAVNALRTRTVDSASLACDVKKFQASRLAQRAARNAAVQNMARMKI